MHACALQVYVYGGQQSEGEARASTWIPTGSLDVIDTRTLTVSLGQAGAAQAQLLAGGFITDLPHPCLCITHRCPCCSLVHLMAHACMGCTQVTTRSVTDAGEDPATAGSTGRSGHAMVGLQDGSESVVLFGGQVRPGLLCCMA